MANDNERKSLDDIVFEHKNKSYGAYRLRKSEKGYLLRAFLIGTAIFTVFIASLFVYNRYIVKPKPVKKTVEAVLRKLDKPEEEKKEEKKKEKVYEMKKTAPQVRQDNVASIKMIGPRVKKDPPRETTIPDRRDIGDKNPGILDKDGNTDDAGNPKPEQKGKDEPIKPKPPEPSVYLPENLTEQAIFKGRGGINTFFETNLKYPPKAEDNRTEGTVTVKFVVREDGSVTDVRVTGRKKNGARVAKLGDGLEEEAVRVVGKMSKLWTPGKINGKPVPSFFSIPISFKLPAE